MRLSIQEDLSNYRNIHTTDYIPKAFESGIVEKSKSRSIDKCNKFQIGAMPGHRSQEHLFVLKNTISLYIYLDIALILLSSIKRIESESKQFMEN